MSTPIDPDMKITVDTRKVIPLDERVRFVDGTMPNKGKTNLCERCGGDPTIAKGNAAIGTPGCICGPQPPKVCPPSAPSPDEALRWVAAEFEGEMPKVAPPQRIGDFVVSGNGRVLIAAKASVVHLDVAPEGSIGEGCLELLPDDVGNEVDLLRFAGWCIIDNGLVYGEPFGGSWLSRAVSVLTSAGYRTGKLNVQPLFDGSVLTIDCGDVKLCVAGLRRNPAAQVVIRSWPEE